MRHVPKSESKKDHHQQQQHRDNKMQEDNTTSTTNISNDKPIGGGKLRRMLKNIVRKDDDFNLELSAEDIALGLDELSLGGGRSKINNNNYKDSGGSDQKEFDPQHPVILKDNSRSASLFLGDYSVAHLEQIFQEKGTMGCISERSGFPVEQLRVLLDTTDDFVHRLSIVAVAPPRPRSANSSSSSQYHDLDATTIATTSPRATSSTSSTTTTTTETTSNNKSLQYPILLMDLNLRRGNNVDQVFKHSFANRNNHFFQFLFPQSNAASDAYEFMVSRLHAEFGASDDFTGLNVLVIEWLQLQNPRAQFTEQKPQLPGQKYPGLGVGRKVHDDLFDLAKRRGRDGLINVPEFFHNAVLYSSIAFVFANPAYQALYNGLYEDVRKEINEKGLAAVSFAISIGYCFLTRPDTDERLKFEWRPEEQVQVISPKMRGYIEGSKFKKLVAKYTPPKGTFVIDWEGAMRHACVRDSIRCKPQDTTTATTTPTPPPPAAEHQHQHEHQQKQNDLHNHGLLVS